MRILLATAALSLIAPVAVAQQQTTPPAQQPGATTPPMSQQAPSATSPSQPSMSTSGKLLQWYNHQPNELRASNLIGSTIRNDAGESIGDINELILTTDGKVAAVVVGVGGFLGIGEREVALDFDSLAVTRDNNGNPTVKVSATRESLKSAPAWTWDRGRPQTGAGGAPASKPATPEKSKP